MSLFCPGRNTTLHDKFLADYPEINLMSILGIDVGSANLLYASKSSKITLCSEEKLLLELHKFLTLAPAHQYIREKWEGLFDHGKDWTQRGKIFAHYNKAYRRRRFKNWSDVATFYCILAMSGFRVHFEGGKLYGEHCPQTPDYAELKNWAQVQRKKNIQYRKTNILSFNTSEDYDNNTLLYIHLPSQYGHYGYDYKWTKSRWLLTIRELQSLALMGHKVCISMTQTQWGSPLKNPYESEIDLDLFYPVTYRGLKASSPYSEVYYVANF